ncbi:hypothetical protein MST22_17470 [Virgibacillus halodenitrificans]|uniref:hypothetical protein n=1 Tax=Virgibacillus halodenitrificans TaxID=1482 RepID=UPI001FB3908A|nr:hypothetical protein [Virgibacillus halodenitrificans]MCJ0932944.1 hypothetical protein [Virgibacillus halodenitrificans]
MEDNSFEEMTFIVNIIGIAKNKGFKIKSENNILLIIYPGYSLKQDIKIVNKSELYAFCNEVLLWN